MDVILPPIKQLLQEHHINLPFVSIVGKGEILSFRHMGGGPDNTVLMIADEASLAAVKPYIAADTLGWLMKESLLFPAPVKPEMQGCVQDVVTQLDVCKADTLVVVGSGSLTDIGKYAAAEAGIKLVVIATAPSMNGYTSANASLIKEGLKQSYAVKLVERLIIVEDIIEAAPEHMQQAGRCDALASISAEIDWRLSHMLLDTPYFPEIFAAEQELFGKVDDAMQLMQLLLIQGLGMTIAGSSAPASGGEHMLAHVVELLHPELCDGMLHGELIGLTHPLYLKYQRQILASPTPPRLREVPSQAELEQLFGEYWPVIAPHYEQKKVLLQTNRANIEKRLAENWGNIQSQSQPLLDQFDKSVSQLTKWQLGDGRVVKERLEKFGGALGVNSSGLDAGSDENVDVGDAGGLSTGRLEEIDIERLLPITHITRNRFTMLDLKNYSN